MQNGGQSGNVPIVLALSNPTDKAECTAEEAFRACNGRVAFGSGTAFQPFRAPDGHEVVPSQANNSLIFPGDCKFKFSERLYLSCTGRGLMDQVSNSSSSYMYSLLPLAQGALGAPRQCLS